MKKNNIFLGILLFPIVLSGQSTNQNYVVTTIPTEMVTDLTVLNSTNSNSTIQYFDGLGRPIQTVQRGFGPGIDRKDLVTYTEYDGMGRDSIQWLPVPKAGNNGAYVDLAAFKTEATNQYGSSEKPYSTIIYESSPVNRVIEQFGVGNDWYLNNKRNRTFYEANDGSVAYFYVDNNGNLKKEGNYEQGSLYKTVSKDEDGKTVEEYKDKLGQVVLKRSKDGSQNIDTYFVNNDLGQLAYVIPPLAADGFTAIGIIYDNNDLLKKYCYLYKYDTRGNCKEKRLPGCEPIYMVYDKAERLILSQDGNQWAKTTKEWTVTKYDVFGRVIFTGITSALSSSVHDNLVTSYKDDLIVETYANGAYSTNKFADATPLTINYYDDYNFRNNLPEPAKTKLNFISLSPYNGQYTSAKGMLTGSRTYYLDGSGIYTATAIYYDYHGQIVQTRSKNHLSGYDITYNQYNFSGQVTKSMTEHSTSETVNSPLTELYTNEYDHIGRLLKTTYKINENPEIILNDMTEVGAYDDLGRQRKKKRHNSTDTEEYEYNVRNWTIRLKSGTFEEKLFYNSNLPSLATPCYNGNIAYSSWTYNGSKYAYIYKYDNLNRLIKADGYKIIGTSGFSNYGYNELFTYDKHGNILNLQRKKGTTYIDWINPGYNGNQMTFANDYYFSQNQSTVKEYHNFNTSGNDCDYDANGNLTKDLDRNIVTIKYNLLNLPEIIQFKDGHLIINAYDAGGQKLKSEYYTYLLKTTIPLTVSVGEIINLPYPSNSFSYSGTAYIDNKEYNCNKVFVNQYGGYYSDDYTFNQLYNTEGYVTGAVILDMNNYESGIQYNYFRKDHLGNIREVWQAAYNKNSGAVAASTIQRTQYYPSGLPWASNSNDNPWVQNKKYNGKEFVEMHGWDVSNLGWRVLYNARLGFDSFDPDAEIDYDISPYAACHNNPVLKVDPNGRWVETAWDVFSLATGAKSFVDNVRQGNVGAAILDGVGVVADAAAVVIPLVPGGVGAGIKAIRVGDKVLDAVQTGKNTEKIVDGAKTINKNANNAEGHFMLYEIKSVDGEVLKVGKADASRINSKGEPVRMKASERSAQKTHPDAKAYPKKDLGKTTTGKAKEAEAADVRNQRASGSKLPLNKERDKRYKN